MAPIQQNDSLSFITALILIVFISKSGLSVLHSIRNHDIISPSQSFERLCNAAVSVKPLGILIHCFSALQYRVRLLKLSTSAWICSPGSCLCVCLSLCLCLCWTLSVEPVSAELCVWNSEQSPAGAQLLLFCMGNLSHQRMSATHPSHSPPAILH